MFRQSNFICASPENNKSVKSLRTIEHLSCEIANTWLNSNKIYGKGEETICAGSDSLHAEMIYAKSLAVAVFTFGNAGLEISKAKQKGQQTTMSEACCGTSSGLFFFSPH